MQPMNNNLVQNQIHPSQQRTPGTPSPAKTSPARNAFSLPEDLVNLSTDRSAQLDSFINKKPSVPVTTGERKALKDSFSVYA